MEAQLETTLRILTDKLGVTVEYLWGVLLKQATVTASTNIIFIIFGVLLLLTTFIWLRRQDDSAECSPLYVEHSNFLWFTWFVLLVLTTLLGIPALYESFTALMNPEYWALRQIIG